MRGCTRPTFVVLDFTRATHDHELTAVVNDAGSQPWSVKSCRTPEPFSCLNLKSRDSFNYALLQAKIGVYVSLSLGIALCDMLDA